MVVGFRCFAEGVVIPRDGVVKPLTVLLFWAHVEIVRAVEAEVLLMGAELKSSASRLVSSILELADCACYGGVGVAVVVGCGRCVVWSKASASKVAIVVVALFGVELRVFPEDAEIIAMLVAV